MQVFKSLSSVLVTGALIGGVTSASASAGAATHRARPDRDKICLIQPVESPDGLSKADEMRRGLEWAKHVFRCRDRDRHAGRQQ